MDAAISKAAQDQFKMPPAEMFPTNKEVELTPSISAYVTRAELPKLVYPDWAAINQNRDAWIREFDTLVAG
jgi:putative spermidine/putrescine transport system substrate-binding protein